jgi:hypothetical protein
VDAWLRADPTVVHERLVAEHGFAGHNRPGQMSD